MNIIIIGQYYILKYRIALQVGKNNERFKV